MNNWDIIIIISITACVILAFRFMRKDIRKGCTGCCATCGQACLRKGEKGHE
ncbi:MAG: FeoB-associated Cys-rich membrane protein [Clostridia bacterium]|nr:FeoB-associated Cys-rich membrane protein [Clostridia bacterium]